MPTPGFGTFRIFRFLRIDVYLHWSWFVVAALLIPERIKGYSSVLWCIVEYLALFGIVLLHEFGHALACRQVGGKAERIMLWPLGGVAYVFPPPRPGPTLWSIAAGPLVNLVLVPILGVLWMLALKAGWRDSNPNAYTLAQAVFLINMILLVFNMLPIYPLDGGQMVRSLLWFFVGPFRSLMFVSVLGIVGVAALLGLAALLQSIWIAIVAVFVFLNCWGSYRKASWMSRLASAPLRPGIACPGCGNAPPVGDFWTCTSCKSHFDTFETQANCPQCGERFSDTQCMACGASYPFGHWLARSSR